MNMVEETSVINDAPKKSNTCGLLALIFALIGVVLTISLIGAPIGIIFLIVAGILGLIGLFKAPRGKAWAGIVISLISLFAIGYAVQWMVNIAFEPIKEFVVWIDEEAKTDTELRLVFKQP
jgi:energy-coupling factor transporter transmembrane protein EcfT